MSKGSDKRKFPVWLVVLIVILVLGVAAIWVQSMFSTELSTQEGLIVTNWISEPLKKLYKLDWVGTAIVRKLAHKIEYGALGIILTLFFLLFQRHKRKPQGLCFYNYLITFASSVVIATAIGALDELIQKFAGRGPLMSDVVLNSISATCAILVTCIVFAIIDAIVRAVKKRKQNKQ